MVGFEPVAIGVGVPLAVAVVSSPLLPENTIYPILLALQSMPKVAIAPLLTLWIGFGALPKIIVVFLVCFFPIVVATGSGNHRPAFSELVQSLCATSLQVFIKVRFPSAMPSIFVGMKIAITLAVIGAVIGEFVGAQDGLGYLILISTLITDSACFRRARSADLNEHRSLLRHRFHGAHCCAVGAKKLSAASPTSSHSSAPQRQQKSDLAPPTPGTDLNACP